MDKGEYKNMFLTAEAQGLACCAAKRWHVGYWTIRVEIIYSARCRIPKWHMWGGGGHKIRQTTLRDKNYFKILQFLFLSFAKSRLAPTPE